MTHDSDEVVRRLALLDRKLNYIAGLGITAYWAAIYYFLHPAVRAYVDDPWAMWIAFACGMMVAAASHWRFHDADP